MPYNCLPHSTATYCRRTAAKRCATRTMPSRQLLRRRLGCSASRRWRRCAAWVAWVAWVACYVRHGGHGWHGRHGRHAVWAPWQPPYSHPFPQADYVDSTNRRACVGRYLVLHTLSPPFHLADHPAAAVPQAGHAARRRPRPAAAHGVPHSGWVLPFAAVQRLVCGALCRKPVGGRHLLRSCPSLGPRRSCLRPRSPPQPDTVAPLPSCLQLCPSLGPRRSSLRPPASSAASAWWSGRSRWVVGAATTVSTTLCREPGAG